MVSETPMANANGPADLEVRDGRNDKSLRDAKDCDRLLRIDQVQERTALGRSTIYRRIAAGAFPRPCSLGPGAIRWRESAIDRWIRTLPEAAVRPVHKNRPP